MTDSTMLSAGLIVGYALLVMILVARKREHLGIGTRRWMVLALAVALVGAVVYVLPADAHTDPDTSGWFVGELTQPALGIAAANLMLVLFGAQTLIYLQYRLAIPWLVIGVAWWGVQAASSLVTADSVIGQEGWLGTVYDPAMWPGVLAVGGWIVISAALLAMAFHAFYRARLPEVANRALFWAVLSVLVLVGVLVGTSGTAMLRETGWVIQFIGLLGAVYGLSVYRVFDVRRTLRTSFGAGIITLLSALLFFVALVAANALEADTPSVYLILGGLALAVALVYIPLRALIQAAARRISGAPMESVSQRLRKFSQEISGVVELDALVDVTMHTLNQVLRVRRGGLILVSEEEAGGLVCEPLPRGLGEMPDITGQIRGTGPIYRQLGRRHAPLLQYDLDFGRAYAECSPDERRFFQQMRMSAYAPVVVQGRLIGILGCGAKISDDPFTDHDLELLMTIASQAGVALRNARLVNDLRRREAEQAELNLALSATTEKLEKLDGVKTDFITIASHELRTPLAQIRGYTDIMEAMNEQGALDEDQIAGMTMNLRKAADRLENLIGAMLDVSQLDVDAMDLRFTQISIENAMRMAIEPLTEAIKSRKLMLSARGLRGLPFIQGDMQRLVQAFRNVVLNAIKFTPDGGRIDISARMQDDDIRITIKDSGVGIDPANHVLIFEKFFRAHDPSLHSTGATKFMGAGPGLGLTIARGVIEGHGGRIWVESAGYDPEHLPGSTFIITLPLNPPDEARRVMPFETASSAGIKQWQDVFDTVMQGDEPEADPSPTIPRPFPGPDA